MVDWTSFPVKTEFSHSKKKLTYTRAIFCACCTAVSIKSVQNPFLISLCFLLPACTYPPPPFPPRFVYDHCTLVLLFFFERNKVHIPQTIWWWCNITPFQASCCVYTLDIFHHFILWWYTHCNSFLRDWVKNHPSNNFCNGRYCRTVNSTSCCSSIPCFGFQLFKFRNRIKYCKTSHVLLLNLRHISNFNQYFLRDVQYTYRIHDI